MKRWSQTWLGRSPHGRKMEFIRHRAKALVTRHVSFGSLAVNGNRSGANKLSRIDVAAAKLMQLNLSEIPRQSHSTFIITGQEIVPNLNGLPGLYVQINTQKCPIATDLTSTSILRNATDTRRVITIALLSNY
jgi:hypothetical protein